MGFLEPSDLALTDQLKAMLDDMQDQINEFYAQAPRNLTDDEKFVKFHIAIEEIMKKYEKPLFIATAMFCRLYMKTHEKESQ